MLVSFIIPIYNEEARVAKTIKALNSYLLSFKDDYEVLFVDDGSRDNTIMAIKNENPKFKYHLLTYQPNRGKGYAIRYGMIRAKGDFRLFFDVDMSTPIAEFDKFRPLLKKDAIIIGNRKDKGSKVIEHQPFLREKMGQVFTLLARILIDWGVTDFTCGFKCFSKEAANKVFRKARIDRWSYDAEILFLTRNFGFKITQVPVRWSDDKKTRVVLLKDTIQSLLDLLSIRISSWRGLYR